MASTSDAGVNIDHSGVYSVTTSANNLDAKIGRSLLTDPTDGNHLVYLIIGNDNVDLDAFYRESFDAGVTWSSPVRINDDPIGNGVVQDMIWGDFDTDGDLLFTWRDRRNGGTGLEVPSEIYASILLAGGSLQPNFILNDSIVDYDPILDDAGNDFMSCHFRNDTIHAVWGDVRTGRINIYNTQNDVENGTSQISEITNPNLTVFPNPATHQISIQGLGQPESFEIYNATGTLIRRGTTTGGKISVEEFPKGVYWLNLKEKNQVTQFIKK